MRSRNFQGAKPAFSSRHFTVAFVIPLHRLARHYGIVDGFTVAANNASVDNPTINVINFDMHDNFFTFVDLFLCRPFGYAWNFFEKEF